MVAIDSAHYGIAHVYQVQVSSERGTASGGGWYAAGSSATASIAPLISQKDLLMNYAFEGWKVNGTIVSTSPSYSFIVTEPMSLAASWRIELNLVTAGAAAVGVMLAIAAVALVALRRSKTPVEP